jgi:DNA-binding transcriptional LysR family regulator
MGIALQPDFIVAPFLAAGTVEAILESFASPALGIYALLPSHRYLPHRVRVLIDFLAARLAQPDP